VQDQDELARQFNENRSRLRNVAFRLLGSAAEAEDALQEAWLKLSRADASGIGNLGGWLTAVVSRVCLDLLRARASRREVAETGPEESGEELSAELSPESELALADAIAPALLVVLETLRPAERIALVLHDMFDLSFEEIAGILERKPAAVRQLATRARRRVKGATTGGALDAGRRRELVGAFLAASRDGDFDRLLALLSPDAVLRVDALAVRTAAAHAKQGAPSLAPEVRGAAKVAEVFKGRAKGALPSLIDGRPGAVWAMGGQIRSAFLFTVQGDRIVAIDLVMEPDELSRMSVQIEKGNPS
jgi:RNA polymerase sigma-70 factor (ECF subfamily)